MVSRNGTETGRPQRPRKSVRIELTADVLLRRAGKSHHKVKVFDLSTHGCKAEFIERPQLDERVWVKFKQLNAIEALSAGPGIPCRPGIRDPIHRPCRDAAHDLKTG